MPSRKGRPNRKKQAFREWLERVCIQENADPFAWMARQIGDITTWVDRDGIVHPTVSLTIKAECASQLAQYLQPKLRSVVVSGDADNPLYHLHELSDTQLAALIARLMRQADIEPIAFSYDGGHVGLPETEGSS